MCGIAGIVTLKGTTVRLPEMISRMTSVISHRGPDDEGFLLKSEEALLPAGGDATHAGNWESHYPYRPVKNIREASGNYYLALGHRRLSIIDPTPAGHQPLCDASSDYWIVFNGEIYNYKILKDELTGLGHSFETGTDTEVLLRCYMQWGKAMHSKLNGMWAFVIYDRRKNVLFGSRDRLGVKPLYFFHSSHLFAFASEQKALLSIPEISPEIHIPAAFEYLLQGKTESCREGMFKNIFELMPSHYFTFDIGKNELTEKKYYELNYEKKTEKFDKKKLELYASQVRERIISSVEARLAADVSIGSCLSGGLDSSSIVCIIDNLMRRRHYRQVGKRQQVFTVSFPNTPDDESSWAKQVVDATATQWHTISPSSGDLHSSLEDIVYYQDIPFYATSSFAQYSVMKLVSSNHVKVTLDGQGGDELFTGYNSHYASFVAEMFLTASPRLLINNLRDKGNFTDKKTLLNFLIKRGMNQFMSSSFQKVKLRHGVFRFLNEDFVDRGKYSEAPAGHIPIHLNALLHQQLTGSDFKGLLRTADRNSMRFSVESRMPFADDLPLMETVFNIPSSYKIHDGWSKYLLRESMKALVPETIVYRRDKKGFVTPEKSWLAALKEPLRSYITPDLDPFFNSKQLLAEWDQIFHYYETRDSRPLWRFINFAIWKKVYGL